MFEMLYEFLQTTTCLDQISSHIEFSVIIYDPLPYYQGVASVECCVPIGRSLNSPYVAMIVDSLVFSGSLYLDCRSSIVCEA